MAGREEGGSTRPQASLPLSGITEAEVVSHTYLEGATDGSGSNLDFSQSRLCQSVWRLCNTPRPACPLANDPSQCWKHLSLVSPP